MKKLFYSLTLSALLLSLPNLYAQDSLSDCEIHLDELELQLKKDQKDTKKYYQIQLEEGNIIFEKDLMALRSYRERRELQKEYKEFVRGLEKDYNREMDTLEDAFYKTLEDLENECGTGMIRRRLLARYDGGYPYERRRPRY